MIKNISIFTLISFKVMIACTNQSKTSDNNFEQMNLLKKIPQTHWGALSYKKIYFGQQSVGFNIMDGVQTHLKENPNIHFRIAEGQSPALFGKTVFAHDQNSKNENPKSKIDPFCASIENGLYKSMYMACFKFYNVNFKNGTDVNDIFQYYKKKMTGSRLKYPEMKILHFTFQLLSMQKWPKGFINKILGREIGVTDNTIRQQFNTLLLKGFSDQPIFDIAENKSTFPDGSRRYTWFDGEKIYSMVPINNYDIGHLSGKGKYWKAAHLLTSFNSQSNA